MFKIRIKAINDRAYDYRGKDDYGKKQAKKFCVAAKVKLVVPKETKFRICMLMKAKTHLENK